MRLGSFLLSKEKKRKAIKGELNCKFYSPARGLRFDSTDLNHHTTR